MCAHTAHEGLSRYLNKYTYTVLSLLYFSNAILRLNKLDRRKPMSQAGTYHTRLLYHNDHVISIEKAERQMEDCGT